VAAMEAFDSAALKESYLKPHQNPEIPDPGQPHDDDPDLPSLLRLSPREIMTRLNRLPCASRTTLNLSNLRVEDVLELLYESEGTITQLELFNLKDHIAGQTDHLAAIAELQQVLNHDDIIGTKRVIQEVMAAVAAADRPDKADRLATLSAILHDIVSLQAYYKGASLRTMIGSDSTGRSPRLHGMGLAVVETLPARARRIIARAERTSSRLIPVRLPVRRRVTLIPRTSPNPLVDALLRGMRRLPGLGRLTYRHRVDWLALVQPAGDGDGAAIVSLGGIRDDSGEELTLTPPRLHDRGMRLSWRYLNTTLKNCLKVFIGFVPAFATFYFTKDWWVLAYGGAFIWFGITGLRNILQSVLGGGGLHRTPLLKWDDYVSWARIADSLLFTGFSVPLLDFLVKTLLLDLGLGITTATDPVALYTVMGLANGIYLSTHNAMRGLPPGAVYGNFFRSVLAIPIAIGLNAGIGWLLASAGHADAAAVLQKWAAVISKAASDTVAGLIEYDPARPGFPRPLPADVLHLCPAGSAIPRRPGPGAHRVPRKNPAHPQPGSPGHEEDPHRLRPGSALFLVVQAPGPAGPQGPGGPDGPGGAAHRPGHPAGSATAAGNQPAFHRRAPGPELLPPPGLLPGPLRRLSRRAPIAQLPAHGARAGPAGPTSGARSPTRSARPGTAGPIQLQPAAGRRSPTGRRRRLDRPPPVELNRSTGPRRRLTPPGFSVMQRA